MSIFKSAPQEAWDNDQRITRADLDDPDTITVLAPLDPTQRVAKHFFLDDGGIIQKRDYDNVYHWVHVGQASTANLEDVYALAVYAQDHPLVTISGTKIRETFLRDPCTRDLATWAPCARHLMVIDIDDLPTSAVPGWDRLSWDDRPQAVWEAIAPPELHDVGFVCQWSSSMGVKGWDTIKAHIYVLLDRPLDAIEHRYLYRVLDGRRRVKNGNTQKGYTYRWDGEAKEIGYDRAPVGSHVQVSYWTPPSFEGMADPFEGLPRVTLREGRRFPLLDSEWGKELDRLLEADKETVKELRSGLKNTEIKVRELRQIKAQGLLALKSGRLASRARCLRALEEMCAEIAAIGQGSKTPYIWGSLAPRLVFGGMFEYLDDTEVLTPLAHAFARRDQALAAAGETRREFTLEGIGAEIERAVAMLWPSQSPQHGIEWTEYDGPRGDLQWSEIERITKGSDTIIVRSPMGSGKTQALKALIATLKDSDKRVVVVSPSRSLVAQSATELGLDHYEDDRDDMHTSKALAITPHSLHKLKIDRKTVLILDESESMSEAAQSHINDSVLTTWRGLINHLRAANRVICLDAHAGETTHRMLGYADRLDGAVWIDNPQRTPKTAEVLLSRDTTYRSAQVDLVKRVVSAVSARVGDRANVHPVVATATTRTQIEALEETLTRSVQGARILAISSTTIAHEAVKLFLNSPDDQLAAYDAVLMSPSVQSGLSIKAPVSLLAAFGRLGSWTSPARFVQQIGRARNPQERVIALDLQAYWATDNADDIADQVIKRAPVVLRGTALGEALSGDLRSWGAREGAEIFDPSFFAAKCKEEAARNGSRNRYVEEVEAILIDLEGYTLTYTDCGVDKEAGKEQALDGKTAKERAITRLAEGAASVETPSDAVKQTLSAKQDLSEEEQWQVFRGQVAWCLGGEPTLDDLRIGAEKPKLQAWSRWHVYATASDEERSLIREKLSNDLVSKRQWYSLELIDRDDRNGMVFDLMVLEKSGLWQRILNHPDEAYCPAEFYQAWNIQGMIALYEDNNLPVPPRLVSDPTRFCHDLAASFGWRFVRAGKRAMVCPAQSDDTIDNSDCAGQRVNLYKLDLEHLALVQRWSAGYRAYLQGLPLQIAEGDLLASLQGSLSEEIPGICGFASSLSETTPREASEILYERTCALLDGTPNPEALEEYPSDICQETCNDILDYLSPSSSPRIGEDEQEAIWASLAAEF